MHSLTCRATHADRASQACGETCLCNSFVNVRAELAYIDMCDKLLLYSCSGVEMVFLMQQGGQSMLADPPAYIDQPAMCYQQTDAAVVLHKYCVC